MGRSISLELRPRVLRVLGVAAFFAIAPGLSAQAPAYGTEPPNPAVRTVLGQVRTATGDPLAGAIVRMSGSGTRVSSDIHGAYTLQPVFAGLDTLRVTCAGYEPLLLAVLVPPTGELHVDLVLSPAPVALSPVRITTPSHSFDDGARSEEEAVPEPGVWTWRGDVATAPGMTGEPDVFRILAARPGHVVLPDGFRTTSLMFGPGSAPTSVLIDGLPVWNPVHMGGVLSSISPDLVGGLQQYDGMAASGYGASIPGTVGVQTRENEVIKPSWSGALSQIAARAAWGSPFRAGTVTGHFLLAGRRSVQAMPMGGSGEDALTDPWSDFGGILTMERGQTAIRVVALASGDRLQSAVVDANDHSDTTISANTLGAGTLGRGTGILGRALRVPWTAGMLGAVWTEQFSHSAVLETRVWRRHFSIANGMSAGSKAGVSDSAISFGAANDVRWGSTSFGSSIDVTRTSYIRSGEHGGGILQRLVASQLANVADSEPSIILRANPAIFAGFAEHRWVGTGDAWKLSLGLRATGIVGNLPFLEPRFELATHLSRHSILSLGYARTNQFVQSLWLTGSPAAGLVPVTLPVAATPGGVPVLSSDMVAARISSRLGSYLTVDVGAYERDFHGLLVSLSSPTEFSAPSGVGATNGHASGVSVGIAGDTARLTWNAGYQLAHTNSTAPLVPGSPRQGIVQDASMALALRVDPGTDIRVAGWLGSPQGADGSELFDGQDQNVANALGRRADDAVLQFNAAAPFVTHPSTYMRLDVAGSHHFQLGSHGSLDVTLTLVNALNRANIAAMVSDPGETELRPVRFTPRSLLAGISWRQ